MQLLSRASKPAPAQRCARAMLDGMPAVMWFIRRQMRKHRTAGLSVPQFRALVLLDQNPTASLSHVADHLGSSTPSASRLITGLVSRGFVTRTECPQDRRQIALVLTPRGRSVLSAARQATQDHLAREIEHLPRADRAKIVAAMKILQIAFAVNGKSEN